MVERTRHEPEDDSESSPDMVEIMLCRKCDKPNKEGRKGTEEEGFPFLSKLEPPMTPGAKSLLKFLEHSEVLPPAGGKPVLEISVSHVGPRR